MVPPGVRPGDSFNVPVPPTVPVVIGYPATTAAGQQYVAPRTQGALLRAKLSPMLAAAGF